MKEKEGINNHQDGRLRGSCSGDGDRSWPMRGGGGVDENESDNKIKQTHMYIREDILQ